jgi:hypothetical protein
MNKAEQFVAERCCRSFLSLWSYPNPMAKKRKELCDCLVVCDPDVIILSVKEIAVTDSGDLSTDWDRWRKKAIAASVKQIYGAERTLRSATHIATKNGKKGLDLPAPGVRRVHRIAVALGGQRKVPLEYGDFGKGFVHVLDERSFVIILRELDTITDFVEYLKAKESLLRTNVNLYLEGGGEEDLLALYLSQGRSFPKGQDMLWLGPDLWATFSSGKAYQKKKEADRQSYAWDSIIEEFCECQQEGTLLCNKDLASTEQAIRTMAKENRFARRVLTKDFLDFLEANKKGEVRSRRCQLPNGTPYVFLACPIETPRDLRRKELTLRCFVVRGGLPDQPAVVGIATEKPGQKWHSLDIVYLHMPKWTKEYAASMAEIQGKLGYFASPRIQHRHEDEYPEN